jgi:hypothetical protein
MIFWLKLSVGKGGNHVSKSSKKTVQQQLGV